MTGFAKGLALTLALWAWLILLSVLVWEALS